MRSISFGKETAYSVVFYRSKYLRRCAAEVSDTRFSLSRDSFYCVCVLYKKEEGVRLIKPRSKNMKSSIACNTQDIPKLASHTQR